ncbi:MAG: hypothetical protein R3348_07815 [Xanthomonadales bacterium]|nr:hypothetical protein [Xanthomonadales bacterium]
MNKRLKVITILAVVAVVLLVAGQWFVSQRLDGYVRDAVVKAGSGELQTEFSVDSVSVSLRRGSAELRGVSIANPEGYSELPLLKVKSVLVDFSIPSLTEDVLVVEEVTVRDPVVSYEINENGVANLDVMEERLAEKRRSSGSGSNEQRIIVEHLEFDGGSITATAARAPDEALVFDFPALVLTKLGSPDGKDPEALGNEVGEILVERILSAARQAGVDQLMDRQKERLLEKAKEKLDKRLDEILDRDG